MIRNELAEIDEEIIYFDGFDEAIIGYVEQFGRPSIALYDRCKCIEILINQGLTFEDATEHFNVNVIGGFLGEYTPSFATIIK